VLSGTPTGIGWWTVNERTPRSELISNIRVAIVAGNGTRWIEVPYVKPFGLDSAEWTGRLHDMYGGMKRQAESLLYAAGRNPINGEPPQVVFEFPLGVSRSVANELAGMGIEVRGEIVADAPPHQTDEVPPGQEGER
jgi:hypothetical protein